MTAMSDAGRVLVVDDSLSVRRAIGRMLAPRGLTVAEATDGSQALERLAGERPDLVICDVMLPGVDGYEVCRFVRARPALAGVPVLLISGVCSPEVEQRATAAGAAGVLAKPFTAKSLIARVDGALDAGRAAAPERHDDPAIEELLAAVGGLPGFRTAYLLDRESGSGRRVGGGPVPPGVSALLRQARDVTAELGLGEPHGLSIEGDAGTLIVQRFGDAALAVCFDRTVVLGLARHQVRLLRSRAEKPTSLPQGDRNGNHPR